MPQTDILLCTLNSTYQHSSFGLRYLYANLEELQSRTCILEWTIKENSRKIVEDILKHKPRVVGFGVYIWNTEEIFEVISILKLVAPDIIVVLGGPEISYEIETQRLYALADYIIAGEADFLFRDFCRQILDSSDVQLPKKIIRGELPSVQSIQLPYRYYTDEDIKNRVIYVEASRGCPYKCEYCLSSLDKSVRSFDLDLFLSEIEHLIQRGARSFKFVDRTFNLSPTTSKKILEFFATKIDLGLFLHFEMVPDRLPAEIKDLIQKFPAGSLQFEVGLQTLNPEVAANVSRKNDLTKVKENFLFLKEHTHVHTHADLIVGLPGENIESFAAGFDALAEMHPDEVQVGILKRLKGTPIARHEQTFSMKYQKSPPFQILSTSTMDYMTLQFMNRFAKFWDLYANRGEFPEFMQTLRQSEKSFFSSFMKFTQFLEQRFSETHSLSLITLSEMAWLYLKELNLSDVEAETIIIKDYCQGYKKRDLPPFLSKKTNAPVSTSAQKIQLNQRQKQHSHQQQK